MDDGYIKVTEQVSWTLSMALINQLSDLLREATRLYLNGDIEKAFFRLKAVRMRIIQNLKQTKSNPERKQCLDKEIEFFKLKLNKEELIENKIKYIETKQEQMRVYEDYNTLLMDLLEKYGYLIKKREDNTNIIV